MKVAAKRVDPALVEADTLVVAANEGVSERAFEPLGPAARALVRHAMYIGDFPSKGGETIVLYPGQEISCPRLVLVGLGPRAERGASRIRSAFASAGRLLVKQKATSCALFLPKSQVGLKELGRMSQLAVEGVAEAAYRFDSIGSGAEDEGPGLESLILVGEDAERLRMLRAGGKRGEVISRGVSTAKDLGNLPANEATPTVLARRARGIASDTGMGCSILGPAKLKKEGLEALLAVSRGSAEEPRLIVLEHWGSRREAVDLAIVGKGLTFDSGGISLKPASDMDLMKFDKAGGAAVLGVMQALSELGVKKNVVGLVPASENLPDARAYKPGDVIRSHGGKTIEIKSTDAEGRLILADALSYAIGQYQPAAMIDLATLTGAMVVALGDVASGVMGNEPSLVRRLVRAGEECGERIWEMPLWRDYADKLKTEVADLKNSAGRGGGALTAGAFLWEFVGDRPWAHVDIAGTAWRSNATGNGAGMGATGVGVRLLVELLNR